MASKPRKPRAGGQARTLRPRPSTRKATTTKRTGRGATRKTTARKRPARKPVVRKPVARKATVRSAATTRRRAARPAARTSRPAAPPERAAVARPPRSRRPAGRSKTPVGLLRERRRLVEEPPPPTARENEERRYSSAALSGREDLLGKLLEHTETGPSMTGGDIDADWGRAGSSGDEAPGGDNPTPDQGLVDDYGKSLGIHYDDNEELRLGDKEAERDRHRWELDPASAEDYGTRDEE